MIRRRALFALLAIALAGCEHLSVKVGPEARVEPRPDVRAEDAAIEDALLKVQTVQASYPISSGDLLEISIYQEKDLDRKVRVSPDGMITFPLIGSVKVGGLGVAEAEALILQHLRRYLVAPQVSVFIKEYGNKFIYVLGEVQKPGSYPLPPEATLSVVEAITLAGGFTQFAASDRTGVIRRVEGKNQKIPIQVSAITGRGDKSKDIPLRPNDVVFVPESRF